MELNQLQVFVIVAEEENLTRAAKRLFTTPSSISMTLKALEDELGMQLFLRTSRGMQITEHGRLLVGKAKKTLQSAQELIHYATEIQSNLIGQVRVGLNLQPNFLRVSEWVSQIRQDFSGVDLEIVGSYTSQIIQDVKANTIDIGFILGELDDPQLHVHRLTDAHVVVVAPTDWRDKLRNASWESLSTFPWVGADFYCPFQTLTMQIFERYRLNYLQAVQTTDDATRMALVKAGVGISFFESTEAHAEAQKGTVFVLETEPIYAPLSLICATHRQHEPLIKAVKGAIIRLWHP
jgi:DNA-binding transcriptional LysR family regulator